MNVHAMMEIAKGDSSIHRLNPIFKLVWLACLIATPIVSMNPFVSIPVLAILWILSIPAKLGKFFYKTMRTMYTIMITVIVITWPFFYGKGTHVIVDYGFLFITWEGIVYALAQGLRVAVAITACLYFVMVTEIIDISNALGVLLQKINISYTVPLMFTTSFKFLPEFMTNYENIKESFTTRAFELDKGSFIQKIKNFIPLFIPLIDSSLGKAQNIATALQLRAFGVNKKRTFFDEYSVTFGDILFALLGIAILIFSIWGQRVHLFGYNL